MRTYPDWIANLNDEDLNFLRRFLLHSGSLKALAAEYEVSYPTVRLRLDKLIQKVRVIEDNAALSPFEQTLRLLLSEHSIDAETYKTLLEAHQTES